MTRAPWNDHIVEPETDPVPPTFYIQWRDRRNAGEWRPQYDEDGWLCEYGDEGEAERQAATFRAERTDDGEPTPYEYRVRMIFK